MAMAIVKKMLRLNVMWDPHSANGWMSSTWKLKNIIKSKILDVFWFIW